MRRSALHLGGECHRPSRRHHPGQLPRRHRRVDHRKLGHHPLLGAGGLHLGESWRHGRLAARGTRHPSRRPCGPRRRTAAGATTAAVAAAVAAKAAAAAVAGPAAAPSDLRLRPHPRWIAVHVGRGDLHAAGGLRHRLPAADRLRPGLWAAVPLGLHALPPARPLQSQPVRRDLLPRQHHRQMGEPEQVREEAPQE